MYNSNFKSRFQKNNKKREDKEYREYKEIKMEKNGWRK